MKTLTLSAITALGVGLISGQAGAIPYYGSVTLRGGETQTVEMSTSARTMRVCNDSFSAGPVAVTIDSNLAHDLSPGVCAEEIGDRMTIQSKASGVATVEYRPLTRDIDD